MLVKVMVDGVEKEVELAGYVPETDVKEKYVERGFMQSEIERRLKGKRNADDLLTDDEFKARALETWGVKPGEPGKGKGGTPTGEELEKLYASWRDKELKPLTEAATKAQAVVERARTRDLHMQILQSAQGLVKPSLLKPATSGGKPPIIALVESYFGHADEQDAWYVKDGETFAYAGTPTKDSPYKGVAEFLADFVKAPEQEWLREDTRQRGAGLGAPGQGKGPDLSGLAPSERLRLHYEGKLK